MKILIWGLLSLLVAWVSLACLLTLLAATGVHWLPEFAFQLREQLLRPGTFLSWVVLPTLLSACIQIWQGQRAYQH